MDKNIWVKDFRTNYICIFFPVSQLDKVILMLNVKQGVRYVFQIPDNFKKRLNFHFLRIHFTSQSASCVGA